MICLSRKKLRNFSLSYIPYYTRVQNKTPIQKTKFYKMFVLFERMPHASVHFIYHRSSGSSVDRV